MKEMFGEKTKTIIKKGMVDLTCGYLDAKHKGKGYQGSHPLSKYLKDNLR